MCSSQPCQAGVALLRSPVLPLRSRSTRLGRTGQFDFAHVLEPLVASDCSSRGLSLCGYVILDERIYVGGELLGVQVPGS